MVEAIEWKRISTLGTGGQSTVYLVRSPERTDELVEASATIRSSMHGPSETQPFIEALRTALRPDLTIELGALKVFDKVRDDNAAPNFRLEREIAILSETYPGLPKLLASNAKEKWLITEFFPLGSLDKAILHFVGDPFRALRAFRSLVCTIAHLHTKSVIHRDIKPANIFLADDSTLVPGDFGIAHEPILTERVTITNERVGPRDYMPQWADIGERLDDVTPAFDVYMLGKLLWCMVAGKLRLPREWHRHPRYDLEKQFPSVKGIPVINDILDRCLSEQESECLSNAGTLLEVIDRELALWPSNLRRGNDGRFVVTCMACQRGTYKEIAENTRVELSHFNDNTNAQQRTIRVVAYSCNVCTHKAFFTQNYPDRARTSLLPTPAN